MLTCLPHGLMAKAAHFLLLVQAPGCAAVFREVLLSALDDLTLVVVEVATLRDRQQRLRAPSPLVHWCGSC